MRRDERETERADCRERERRARQRERKEADRELCVPGAVYGTNEGRASGGIVLMYSNHSVVDDGCCVVARSGALTAGVVDRCRAEVRDVDDVCYTGRECRGILQYCTV